MASPYLQSKNTKKQQHNSSNAQHQSKNSSVKKKPFARKPATPHSSQRKKKSIDDFIESSLTDPHQLQTNPFTINTPAKMNFVKRKERQTEFYNKQKQDTHSEKDKDSSLNAYSKKNIPHHIPYPSKKIQFQTLSNMSSSINTQSYSKITHISHLPTPNSTRVVSSHHNEQLRTSYEQLEQPLISRQRKNESNLQNPNNLSSTYSKYSRLNTLNQSNKLERTKGEGANIVQCFYCKNNKQMTDIMCQKYSKLEQQLKSKNVKIKDLTFKYENLKEEHNKLAEKYEHKLQSSQLKEIQFFREKEELVNRIDTFKNQISKLSQKIKYSEIQNSVLLRYKDQYQLMIKQYDLIAYQNEKLHRSINNFKREGPFKKEKGASKQKQKIVSNTNYSKKSSTEDDLMSLSLSEQSIDYF